jgi:caffeoyl-CoA O-methyltransferase
VDIVAAQVEKYMGELAAVDDEPVLLEMESLAKEREFPIIGRLCGRTLEVMARAIGARRIFELGSGFGYSAYWFSRATGPEGEIHLTDTDPDNERSARDYLGRAGLDTPITYHVADALEALGEASGQFDIVYCDIDKLGYPRAWREGRERVRVGGLYISDNMLWRGEVADYERSNRLVRAIDETNRSIAADPDWRSTIVPTRDGVVVAVRVR